VSLPSPTVLAALLSADVALAGAALLLAYQEALRQLAVERGHAAELDRLLTSERAWRVTR
jgi:hypothetical protein